LIPTFDAAPNPIWVEPAPPSGPSMEASFLPAAEEMVSNHPAPSHPLAGLFLGLNHLGHGMSGAAPCPIPGRVNHHFAPPLCVTGQASLCPPNADSWFILHSKTNPPESPSVKFFRPPR
jgi:hypothetical protein